MTVRRRVLVLNHFAAPRDSPGGTRHVELFSRLERWETTVLAANRNLLARGRQGRDGVLETVWALPHASGHASRVLSWLTYAGSALAAGALRGPVDAVYASTPHLPAGLSGWALARLRRVPLVVEVRDLWPQVLADMGHLRPESMAFRAMKAAERFLYRRADAVVVLAAGAAADVVADGARADRVVFLPNGADPDDFTVDADREALRRVWGMDSTVVIYAGAHGPANGLDRVLDAAADLARTAPQVTLWLVGDGVAKPALQEEARRRGLANVVFRDPVPKRDMPALLAAADVGLHTLADVPLFSRAVSPNKLFDYMAAGLPVVTNTPGEVAAIVERSGAGVAVPPAGLAEGIRRVATASAEERARWGAAGRRWLAENRSRTKLARRLERLLDGLVDGAEIGDQDRLGAARQ